MIITTYIINTKNHANTILIKTHKSPALPAKTDPKTKNCQHRPRAKILTNLHTQRQHRRNLTPVDELHRLQFLEHKRCLTSSNQIC